jgi:outer membrane lipoprotein-sorting protein
MKKLNFAIIAAMLALSSCAPRVAIKPIPVNTPPEEIIQMASAGTENIKGLKAFVKVTVQKDGNNPQSIDGVLYIERPDNFRFTGLAFMGFTVFDLVLTGDKFYFYRPSEGWLYTGPRESFKGFLAKNGVQADPEVIGKALFLRKKEGEQFLVEKTDDGYDIYQAVKDEGVLLPRMKAEFDAGMNLERKIFFDGLARPYLYVTPSGKIEQDGAALPKRLTVKDIAQGVLLTVDFEKYIINPEGLDKDFTIQGQELKGIREVQ